MTTEVKEEVMQGEQIPLIPEEVTYEEETREVLVPLQPHEVLEIVDRMGTMNEELKGHVADKETEKTRHKEAKEKIEGRISTVTEDLSKLIDQAAMRKRKSLEKVKKRINHTTKLVDFIWKNPVSGEDVVVETRAMLPAEYQLKLIPDEQPENVVPITDGDAAGVDPASFEGEAAEKAEMDEIVDEVDHELGDNVVDEEEEAQ